MPQEAVRKLLVGALALALGISFGLNYATSNQLFYLLPSLLELQPELLRKDWLATETQFYHPTFAWLGAVLLRADSSGWLIACGAVLVNTCGALAAAGLAGALAPQRRLSAAVWSLALCMALRTQGPGGSAVFTGIFQPSSLGALGLLVSAIAFAHARYGWAGLALAVGGAFHANYLLLGLVVTAGAAAYAWRPDSLASGYGAWLQRTWRQWLWLLAPATVVLVCLLRLILATGHSPVAHEAERIYQDVRSPHHYDVARFWPHLLTWLGWQGLGFAALAQLQVTAPARELLKRLNALLLALVLFVVCCVVFSSVLRVRSINHLFAWRIAPIGALLAQVALVAAACSAGGFWPQRGQRWLCAAALALLALGCVFTRDPLPLALCAVLGLTALFAPKAERWLLSAGLSAFAVSAVLNFQRLPARSTLLAERVAGLGQLCAWIKQQTPHDALFLTPPDLEEFRYHCQRAIVVDWKSNPMVPEEVLAWLERLQAVSGTAPLRAERDLQGYYRLTPPQLTALQQRFGFEYLVTRTAQPWSLQLKPVFQGTHFVVYHAAPGAPAH